MDSATLSTIKRVLREEDIPFFSDEDIEAYYEQCDCDLNRTLYRCCLAKSEDTTIQISGLSLADTSKYFLRLAQQYRPHNSGILKGF